MPVLAPRSPALAAITIACLGPWRQLAAGARPLPGNLHPPVGGDLDSRSQS
jgi:hypothetical protein